MGRRGPAPEQPLPLPAHRLSLTLLQVRASGAASKREFLQRKGLTEEEIDEAFRRVPQEATAAAAPAPAPAAPPSAVQATLQHLQPGPPYSTAATPQQQQLQQYGQPPPPPQQGMRWTQVRCRSVVELSLVPGH